MDIEGVFFETSEYELIKKKIGEGTFGEVYIAKNVIDNKFYALKIIKTNSNFNGHDQMMFMRESIILNELKHPGIIGFKGINFQSFLDPNILQPSIITEYLKRGSLKLILDKEKSSLSDPNWSPTKKYIILLGISNAMKYLHKKGIIHRDLKPENILIDENYYPKICDFGLSRCFEKELTKSIELTLSGQFGTPLYMAPELILGEDHCTSSVDVYAFSILAYEIVVKKVPFFELGNKMNIVLLATKVTNGYRPKFPEYVPKKMQQLISRCWSEKPKERPSFEEIFNELASDFTFLGEKVDEDEVKKYLSMLEKNQSPDNNSFRNTNCGVSNELFIKSLHNFHGSKNEINPIEALHLLKLSSDKGNSYASYTLGLMYVNGNGVEKDFEKGKLYFERSSEQGNPAGLFGIAFSYHFGHGVKKDDSKAAEYYQKAADLGNSDAFVKLGDFYYEGRVFEQNYSKAAEYYQKAADLANSDALVKLGDFYYKGRVFEQNYSKAVEYYQKAADLGNSDAFLKLGDFYYEGRVFEQNDSKAVEYYQKAADLANSDAFLKLGDLYYEGLVFEENYSKAAEYYQKAGLPNNQHLKEKIIDCIRRSFKGDYILFLSNISYDITDDEIKEFFSRFGPVSKAKIVTMLDHGQQVSPGFGFVQMGDQQSFQTILSNKDPIILRNRYLIIDIARPPIERRAIFLPNLPEGTTSDDIRNALKDFNIVDISIHETPQKRFAFVNFESEKVMKACCEKRCVNIKGSEIVISVAKTQSFRPGNSGRRRRRGRKKFKVVDSSLKEEV